MKAGETFSCPVCGGAVNTRAHACPHCGADERTGWSDQTYLDGIDVGTEIDYDDLAETEFPGLRPHSRKPVHWTMIIAGILLLLSLLGLIKIVL